ncbi:MAG TPA: AtpZ/AtpI family protein [Planctomycetota bacterium]|nr:AtpZ/AtpI family protein [Planctomycetota bacterium]
MPEAPPPPEKQSSADSPEGKGGGSQSEAKQDSNLWRLAGLGTEVAGSVAFFTAVGWWLDSRFGWTPWGMFGFGMVGIVVGLYRLIRAATR